MSRRLDKLRLRLRSLFRSSAVDRELARELRAHLDEEIANNVASGMTPAEARRTAVLAFGPVTSIEDACRDTRRTGFIEHFIRDVRYAWRTLSRQPGLLFAAAASIGLGAGANCLILALANNLLLSTPTSARPSELVVIRTDNGSHVSYRSWQELNESGALAAIAGYQFEQSLNWRDGASSVSLIPMLVTANFFDVLGAPMSAGRGFTAAEAAAELNPRVVVISYSFWRNRLAGDPNVLGRSIVLNGDAYTVTGVLPVKFTSIAGFGLAPDVYLPLSRTLVPSLLEPRTAAASLFGRLRADQTMAQGRAAVEAVAARVGAGPDPEFKRIKVFGSVGSISQVNELRALAIFFAILAVISALVLAIACANVAGLLLARSLARRREIALRLALGASRGRLIQQLLTESLVLSVAGAAVGAVLTAAGFIALSRVSLPLPLPFELHFALDWRMTTLAVGLVLASTCLTGIVPALQATRPALAPSIKVEDPPLLTRRMTLRNVLVVGQVAVSLGLLVAALLFLHNLRRAVTVDPGFEVDRLLVAQVAFVEGRQGAAGDAAIVRLADRVASVPGVATAAASNGVPLTIFSGGRTGTEVRIDDRPDPIRVEFDDSSIGPGYFEAIGIARLSGRDFTAADRRGAAEVIIVNEEFARRYVAGRDAVGRRVQLDRSAPFAEIIGVVANSKYRSLAEDREPAIYYPLLQGRSTQRLAHVLIRTNAPMSDTATAIRPVMQAFDSTAAVTITPMRSELTFATLPSRLASITLGLLGALGTLLAMVGLFGVVSFSVSRRMAEIAIRMALGASRADVFRLILGHAGRLVGAGLVIGLALAVLITAPLASFLVAGLSPLDPASYLTAALVLGASSLAAIWSPMRRALRVSPFRVLKQL